MPRLDIYHNVVKAALVKDGWTITHDPFTIGFEDLTVYADLGAEKLIAAERSERKIAVEVKVFISPSPVTDLERAVGQYYLYSTFMARLDPERTLYLAIPKRPYENFFQRPSIQEFMQERQFPLIVFNPDLEEIVLWKS
jgi:hypothetical protein